MGISPLVFTGISKFSTDFQTIVDRAVSIAQLPVKALQNQQTDILQRKTLAGNLNSAVADLAKAIAALGTVGSSRGVTGSSSDSAKVSIISTTATAPASYTISNITSLAKAASETSVTGFAEGTSGAVSVDGAMKLVVGSNQYTITLTPAKNNLAGLRDAINNLNAGVTANILTTGTGATPNYLSVTATTSGATTLKLTDIPANTPIPKLTTVNPGSPTTPASAVSLSSYATAGATSVSTSGQMALVVGGQNYAITLAPANNNLNRLAAAINAAGAGVTATVVNSGSGPTPFSLSVTANANGANTIALNDLPNNPQTEFLTATNQGANTVFKLNGVNVSKSGTLINDVAPGVTFSVLATTSGSEAVTLTVASDSGKISSALKDLATKYNAVLKLVNAQIGPNAGLLSGNNMVRATQDAMRALTTYQGAGAIKGLSALGVELSRSGEMSFNQSTSDANKVSFDKLSGADIAAAFTFLGSEITGLGALNSRFTQISDPTTGLIKQQQDQFDVADKRITDQVATITARITLMQTALRTKLQRADSLLAALESQQNVLTTSIEAMNYTLYGRRENQ